MSFEYLIVGISKGQQEDYREFYNKTKVEAYMFALSIVKDRVLARDITVEAYRRVHSLAYKFDTDLNAEYWLLDIVKNLSVNALKHSELKRAADSNRIDTLTRLLSDLIIDTAEDRSKFIVLRTVSGLKKAEISRLLWYKGGSASAEYKRGIRELLEADKVNRSKKTIIQELIDDMNSCTPDMWGLIIKEEETRVSFVSHAELDIEDEEIDFSEDKEELRQIKRANDRRKRAVKIWSVAIAVVLLCAVAIGIVAAVIAFDDEDSTPKDDSSEPVFDIVLPQSGTSIAMAELDGVLYFANYADGGKFYKADYSSGKAVISKISDDVPKDIVVSDDVGKYVVYRNYPAGDAYRYSPSDGSSVLLCKNVGAMCINGDILYYSSSEGICSMSVTKGESTIKSVLTEVNDQNIADLPIRYDIEVVDNGTIYFSAGGDTDNPGIFTIKEVSDDNTGDVETYHENINVKADIGNVYDMYMYDGCIFFDVSGNNSSALYMIDTNADNKITFYENVYLSSAAIAIRDGYIYYAGYLDNPKDNKDATRGLCRLKIDGGTPEMIIVQNDLSLYISDLYVSDSKIYCYSCTADKNGVRRLTAYQKDGLNKDNFAGKSIAIF